MKYKYSQTAVKLIQRTRKFSAVPEVYWNKKEYIGYGQLAKFYKIDKISKKKALENLERELTYISRNVSKQLTTTVTQNQFDALVSLVYDVGIVGVISTGTFDHINKGNLVEASQSFRLWSQYKRTQIYQLSKARKEEIALFNTPERELNDTK